jgi:uncharacterized Zn finger protein
LAWYRDLDFFPSSTPLPARGGIKARTKRGDFGRNWWAERWISVLEQLEIGARLGRGKSYARRGQVLDIAIEKGCVRARVQGSRPQPYGVTIRIKPLGGMHWSRLTKALAREARFTAKLLACEMPRDIETAFRQAGVSLFPERSRDLVTECSCPDWANPCKHVAAVYYLLGEEFDRDPFLIFRLRGMTRQDLVRALRAATPPRARSAGAGIPLPAGGESQHPAAEPLRSDSGSFWTGGSLGEDLFGEVRVPVAKAALLRRLGAFPFWRGSEPLLESLEPIYDRAAARGLRVFLGQRSGESTPQTPRVSPRARKSPTIRSS